MTVFSKPLFGWPKMATGHARGSFHSHGKAYLIFIKTCLPGVNSITNYFFIHDARQTQQMMATWPSVATWIGAIG